MEDSKKSLPSVYLSVNIDSAITFAKLNCSATSITYSEFFDAAGLKSPQCYFENEFRKVVTDFMESFHFACARLGLPPFDAFIVNASGERANYPGVGYFLINGLSDPCNERTPINRAREANAFREEQLVQIRDWCRSNLY